MGTGGEWGVRKAQDPRSAGEELADGGALDAEAFAVDDAANRPTLPFGFFQPLLDDGEDIAGRNGMEINDIGEDPDNRGFGVERKIGIIGEFVTHGCVYSC